MLSSSKHEKSFITLGPRGQSLPGVTALVVVGVVGFTVVCFVVAVVECACVVRTGTADVDV